MEIRTRSRVAFAFLAAGLALATVPAPVRSQAAPAEQKKDKKAKDPNAPKEPKEPKDPKGESKVPTLWTSETPIPMTLRVNIKQVRKDKGEGAPWRWASLSYQDSGKTIDVPLRVRTRGIYRLKNCQFPPLRLNFSGKETKNTIFEDVDKPKLVNYCKDQDAYEQYILQETQLYRIYQLLTPLSHRVRLAKMSYVDSASGKSDAQRYAIIVEDPDALANRFKAKIVKQKGAQAADFEPSELAMAYMFLYFIGNLDFSFNGLHNTELLATLDGRILPVSYDFDYAGAVNTSYAVPPPNYNVSSVRQRKFLGYCEIAPEYPGAVAKFIEKKDAIYALYRDEIGKLLSPSIVRETLSYFDDFYEQVKTPQDAERNIIRYCIKPH
jgi:hypothetical protein